MSVSRIQDRDRESLELTVKLVKASAKNICPHMLNKYAHYVHEKTHPSRPQLKMSITYTRHAHHQPSRTQLEPLITQWQGTPIACT